MLINNRKRKIISIFAILLSLIFATIVGVLAAEFGVAFSNMYNVDMSIITPFVQFFAGMFLVVSIGLLFNSDSRIIGIVYAVCVSIIPLIWIVAEMIANENQFILCYVLGIIVGCLLTGLAIVKNRGDIIVKMTKGLLTIFWLFILGFLFYILYLSYLDSFGSFIAVLILGGVPAVICSILYVIMLKITIGVRGSDVFVIGPRASGKTYFGVALWDYLTKHGGCSTETAILSPNGDDERNLSLSSQWEIITRGDKEGKKILKRTFKDQIVMYQLEVKKYGFIPVKWTIVDYAGEHYDHINKKDYNNAVSKVLGTFEGKPKRLSPDEIHKYAGSMQFLNFIKNYYSEELKIDQEFVESIIIITIYGNFVKAGKTIFLIDGAKMTNDAEMAKLAVEFEGYVNILNDLKYARASKKFAIVVTKTDKICLMNPDINKKLGNISSLSDVDENLTARKIEKMLYDTLLDTPSFRNLINRINDLSTYFVAVSVDKTARYIDGDVEPASSKGTTLSPWGFSEIIRFGK